MHEITTAGNYGLEVTLVTTSGSVKTATWNSFVISGESDKFRLSISGFNASNSGLSNYFAPLNGYRFQHRIEIMMDIALIAPVIMDLDGGSVVAEVVF